MSIYPTCKQQISDELNELDTKRKQNNNNDNDHLDKILIFIGKLIEVQSKAEDYIHVVCRSIS